MTKNISGKSIAILSYLWLVGWVVAMILHQQHRTAFATFHLRQSFGLLLVSIIVWMFTILIGFIGIPILVWMIYLSLFVLWLLGILSAIKNEKFMIPVVGTSFQKWLQVIE